MGNLKEDDLGDAGAWALFKGSVKLIWENSRLFLLILALTAFPVLAVEQALSEIFISVEVKPVLLPALQKLETSNRASNRASNYTDFDVKPAALASTAAGLVGGTLIDELLVIIPVICVVYSVAALLSKKTVTVADAVGAVPRLWRPVILTTLSLFAVGIGGWLIIGLVSVAAYLLSSTVLVVVAVVVSGVLGFLLFTLQLAVVASVLEGVYGFKALGKSWRLIQGRKWVTFRTMLLCYLVIACITFASGLITSGILAILGISKDPLERTTSFGILASTIQVVSSAALVSVSTVLVLVAKTFLYFSCKALHRESVTESGFFQLEVLQGAYESVEKGSESYEV